MHLLALVLTLLADIKLPPANAEHLDSGLITVKLFDGAGNLHPDSDDLVKVRYSIWNSEGKLIDSIPADKAAIMSVSRMMPGWQEAVENMLVGEQRRSWIPAALGGGKIPANDAYVVDTELVDIIHGPKTPE